MCAVRRECLPQFCISCCVRSEEPSLCDSLLVVLLYCQESVRWMSLRFLDFSILVRLVSVLTNKLPRPIINGAFSASWYRRASEPPHFVVSFDVRQVLIGVQYCIRITQALSRDEHQRP